MVYYSTYYPSYSPRCDLCASRHYVMSGQSKGYTFCEEPFPDRRGYVVLDVNPKKELISITQQG